MTFAFKCSYCSRLDSETHSCQGKRLAFRKFQQDEAWYLERIDKLTKKNRDLKKDVSNLEDQVDDLNRLNRKLNQKLLKKTQESGIEQGKAEEKEKTIQRQQAEKEALLKMVQQTGRQINQILSQQTQTAIVACIKSRWKEGMDFNAIVNGIINGSVNGSKTTLKEITELHGLNSHHVLMSTQDLVQSLKDNP